VRDEEHPSKLPISTDHDKRVSSFAPDFATDDCVVSYRLAREEQQRGGTGMNPLMEGPRVLASAPASWQRLGCDARQGSFILIIPSSEREWWFWSFLGVCVY